VIEPINDYQTMFLSDVPLIDLRAPCEFTNGAFPCSTSLPLMSDHQRHLVGLCYKEQGQQKAIELGHSLVNGEDKRLLVDSWIEFAQGQPNGCYFYCFRGGLRSRTSQKWASEAGLELPIVEGGYKAMRQYLIEQTESISASASIKILTGYTGSAKTHLLSNIKNAVDLEAIANHRGSSFGQQITSQPTQIDFENRLAIELIKLNANRPAFVLFEDESRLIGSRSIPLCLKQHMDSADLIMVDESFEFRCEQIFKDYVVELFPNYLSRYGDNGLSEYNNYLVNSTLKIKKRLGGDRVERLLKLIDRAIKAQRKNENLDYHRDWIGFLLQKYYDPMYAYQLSKKNERVIFRGDTAQVQRFIEQRL
jgi:tRNA 2-selenouridine synthase